MRVAAQCSFFGLKRALDLTSGFLSLQSALDQRPARSPQTGQSTVFCDLFFLFFSFSFETTMTNTSSPPPPLSDPPGAEARRCVHWGHGGRGKPVRAAMLPAAGRDGARGGLLPPSVPLHGRHRPGQPAGPGRLQHAHRGERDRERSTSDWLIHLIYSMHSHLELLGLIQFGCKSKKQKKLSESR